ncbi:MAG: N-acetylmuramoyl-L-alanine amidase [Xanthobacteraceae bacterium]|nr:N-acetylmuramoyl-L-alanine amidase [Xanthobacteraceae bacterium]
MTIAHRLCACANTRGVALLGALALVTASQALAASPVKRTAAASCDRAQFRAIIDVGHSQKSPGALSARGVNEFDFNLRLARDIHHHLTEMGFTRTILLVSEGAQHHSLATRVARANQSAADVFLSIHHDSVPDRMLQKWDVDGTTRRYNDQYPGHSIFVSIDNPDYQSSLLFATIIGKELKARGMKYTPHYTDAIMGSRRRLLVDTDAGVYRYDQLIVLRQTHMPAVLLEAGSIVNRSEELELEKPERRKLVAAAVGEALDRYCQMRPPVEQAQEKQASSTAHTHTATRGSLSRREAVR